MRPTLLGLLVVPCGLCSAQSTYTLDDATTTIGQAFIFHNTGIDLSQPAGEDLVWDLSTVAEFSTITSVVSDPGVGTPFGTADRAMVDNMGMSTLLTEGPTEELYWGWESGGGQFIYEVPEIVRQFPMTFGTSWNNAFSGAGFIGEYAFDREGTLTAVVDAWGTAILPYGTIENVLRLTITRTYLQTNATSTLDFYDQDYYLLAPGNSQPIAFSWTSTSSDGTQVWSTGGGRYLDEASLGLRTTAAVSYGLSLSPIPTQEFVSLTLASPVSERVSIDVLDASGRLVRPVWTGKTSVGPRVMRFEVGDLASGLYIIRVNGEQGTAARTLVVER